VRYLGGKSRIAKEIAALVAPQGAWWEPFCGGLSVSVQLAKYGPGLVSDVHPALMALYQAVRAGWQPPRVFSKEQHAAASQLPDTDPRKAFAGFGLSYGGDWFCGYAGEVGLRYVAARKHRGPSVDRRDQVAATAQAVTRDVAALAACELRRLSFFDVTPTRGRFEAVYCDPPYADTTGYKGVAPFDHARFWETCARWAALGTRVFVSEYACPLACKTVMERTHRDRMRRASGWQRLKVEKLFLLDAGAPSVKLSGVGRLLSARP
jgi:site-specific DNA-adenine methylase